MLDCGRLTSTGRETGMEEIGPVDYVVVAFPGNQFKGEIVPALEDLVKAGTVRIIDTAFVGKDEKGEIFTLEVTELDPDVQEALDALEMEVQGLFNDEELLAIGQNLEPNFSAAVLVWENVWARKVAQAIRDAGGVMVAFERIPHDTVQAAREWALEEAKV
jgi:Family of unknown function (DUF6325)